MIQYEFMCLLIRASIGNILCEEDNCSNWTVSRLATLDQAPGLMGARLAGEERVGEESLAAGHGLRDGHDRSDLEREGGERVSANR